MNMHTRILVLENSLVLEKNVKELVKFFFNIYNESGKTLSNKSGRLSFKSQIDLLFDVDIFNKVEYQKCLLIMEFRNQFMHNIECNTMMEAIKILDNENQFLKYCEKDKLFPLHKKISKQKAEKELTENELEIAFLTLVLEVSVLIKTKLFHRLDLFNENKAFINDLCHDVIKGYQMHFDFINLILSELKSNGKDDDELTKFKADLKQKIDNPAERIKIASGIKDKINAAYKCQVMQRVYKSV